MLICLKCAETWDMDYVLHEAPEEFERTGGAIHECPDCMGKKITLEPHIKHKMAGLHEVAMLLGDDVDGYAAMIEDIGLI